MRFERILAYQRPDNIMLFDVQMQMEGKETQDQCFYKLAELLKAYFGTLADFDSRHEELLAKTVEENHSASHRELTPSSEPLGLAKSLGYGRVPQAVLGFFREVVREKFGFDSDQEAEAVLKRLFGVVNLQEATRQKALEVLEKIALGTI